MFVKKSDRSRGYSFLQYLLVSRFIDLVEETPEFVRLYQSRNDIIDDRMWKHTEDLQQKKPRSTERDLDINMWTSQSYVKVRRKNHTNDLLMRGFL